MSLRSLTARTTAAPARTGAPESAVTTPPRRGVPGDAADADQRALTGREGTCGAMTMTSVGPRGCETDGFARATAYVAVNIAKGSMPGEDRREQIRPFKFVQADAMTFPLDGFDAVHAPPCQDRSRLRHLHERRGTGWLLAATRDRLTLWGGPWVIENVGGAGLPARGDLLGASGLLPCGAVYGRGLHRHRLFETIFAIAPPHHPRQLAPASQAGHREPGTAICVAGNCSPLAAGRGPMGIGWMNRAGLAEASPPAYTEHVGARLPGHVAVTGAA